MPPQSLASDLSILPQNILSDHGLTSHMASRYHQGLPYATISTGMLIALNTFAPFDVNQDQLFKDMAARIYNRLVKRGESQLVLFLGESGSGKSEFRDNLTDHLLTLSNNPLSRKIKNADFVFNSFTTTKTASCMFASRAGHVLELQYGSDATLIGASLLDYRLERSRITKVPTAERNYHIFYYLVSGLSDSEKDHLLLSDVQSHRYRYLGHHSQLKVGIDDREKFSQFKSALRSLEFSRPDIANISQVLAAILHIGQLLFRSTGDDGTNSAAIEVTNDDVLRCIAAFLGVMPDVLLNTLSYKTVTIANDRVTLVLDQRGARENADELARTLYTLLFSWILERINSTLSRARVGWSEELDSMVDNTISVVDFPGFSISASVPTIDRLLHNSANEVLYSFVLQSYFEKPAQLYGSEEVVVPSAEYFDNSDTVKALMHPSIGVLALIDDYSKKNLQDRNVLETLRTRFDKSSAVETTTARRSFSVRHFAGEVEYTVDGLLAANREDISGDIISLFTSSSSSDFLKALFSASAVVDETFGSQGKVVEAHLSSKPLRAPSLVRKDQANRIKKKRSKKLQKKPDASGQFLMAIDSLIDSFDGANPYFVVCLKPNDHRLSSNFDARCVRQQIKAFGIPEIAKRVKQTDYSLFMAFNEFLSCAYSDAGPPPGSESMSERDQAIQYISTKSWPERDVKYGLTGVFLSENAWLQLIDPKMSFAESANQKYLESGGMRGMGYSNQDGFYYDVDQKSIGGITTTGDMFKFADVGSVNKEAYIHSKEFGESEEDQTETIPVTWARRRWMFLVYLFTWFIPDFFIKHIGRVGRDRKDIRIAWREKLAINLMIWLSCAACVIFLIGFPILICPLQNVLSTAELSNYSYDNNPDHVWTSINGIVFDITNFANTHYPKVVSTTEITDYGGKDSSDLFPIQISAVCNQLNGRALSDYIVYGQVSNYSDSNAVYHDFRYYKNDSRPDWYLQQMYYFNRNYRKKYIGYTPTAMKKLVTKKSKYASSLHGYVYDFTDYINGAIDTKAPAGKSVPSGIDKNFMDSRISNLFQQNAGQDVSSKFDKLGLDVDEIFQAKRCLRNVFMIGKLDTRDSVKCKFARYFLLAITIFVVLIILIKFLAALQFGREERPDDLNKFFIAQVPAYTEDEESLRRAIDSLARTNYDDKRKLLFIICDGMIVGRGNDKPTPRIVLDILGCPKDANPVAHSFESLGEGAQQHNMGKIYTGLYEVHGHIVPYVVVVKVGTPDEPNRPGNRGKRDSQLLLMRFLNRVHYGLPMNPLELELYHQIQNVIGVNPTSYEFLMQVDADTVVHPDSARQFVASFIKNTKLQAICGETALSNAKSSMITMIQVYEYYISHNLVKAFESLFGTVTCLPGCFSMYRIYEADNQKPLFVSHPIVKGYSENHVDTLHVKNLLQLGEDRYLTTLLLRYNSRFKTKYFRHAKAWTVAPDNWSVFLSQRRRWINSTVHNLVELAPMSGMCGFCCFSMRFIVMVDLFSTIIQPVTVAYLAYLAYLCETEKNNIPYTSIILLAAIYGLQAIIFLLRRRWEMIGWMMVYILAIPIFSLALPLYSFWYMDDFSWGSTRVIQGDNGKKTVLSTAGKFDPSEIPLQRWEDYQSEMIAHQDEPMADTLSVAQQSHYSDFVGGGRPASIVRASTPGTYGPFSDRNASRPVSSLGMDENEYEMSLMTGGAGEQTNLLLPSDEELTESIREILSTADLMQVTKKSIRQQLEKEYGMKLTAKREYIKYVVEAILTGEL